MRQINILTLGILLTMPLFSVVLFAQVPTTWEAGVRFDGNLGSGSPANDILGGSLIAKYRLNNEWFIGAAIEVASEWDVERPNDELGISSTEVVDAKAETTMLSIWAERRYNEQNRGAYWYWTVGMGYTDVEADDAIGTTTDGDPYHLVFDIDNEVVITFTGGRRHNISDSWSVGYGARLEQRTGDWNVRDLESGTSKVVYDSYTIYGVFADTYFRF